MNERECPIHYGSYLLKNVEGRQTQVFKDFRSVGLLPLIVHEDRVYEDLVRQFYQHFYLGRNSVSFRLKGQIHEMSFSRFSRYMGLPANDDDILFYVKSETFDEEVFHDAGEDVYDVLEDILDPSYFEQCVTTERVLMEHLKSDLFVYYRVIRENITCRHMWHTMDGQPSVDSVTVMEALMLFWVNNGKRFNMGFIMANVIVENSEVHPSCPIPYGMRLTYLFKRLKILAQEDGPGIQVPRVALI